MVEARVRDEVELRTAVNAVRVLAGLGDAIWTYPVGVGSRIRVADITDLRNSLDAAMTQINSANLTRLMTGGWSSVVTGTAVKAAHFTDLRNRMN
jgi:hypothetical protein